MNPHGLRSEGAFARLCGLAPLPTIGISSPWRDRAANTPSAALRNAIAPWAGRMWPMPGRSPLAIVLADPSGQLSGLHAAARHYPIALREKVVTSTLWEASFYIDIARKAVGRENTAYVAGCLFRAITLCAHGSTPPRGSG
ncbi:MAG: hypothetical protein JWO98_1258 [Frankiales bacterium]|nr:hypothetical protein [Frankiales bacterium]